MTFHIALLLGIILVAMVLFSLDWLSSDVVALGVVLALILTGLLSPADAFAGFGSETVITILALLIMTSALVKTGVVDMAGRAILRHAGTQPLPLLAVIMVGCGTLSAFIGTTAATAFFTPIAVGLASKAKISPSYLLMPVAFSSILSSSVTLISTSTNLVVNGLMTRAGLAPMSIFELTPIGVPIAITGLAYMLLVGRHFVPKRAAVGLLEQFGLRSYITEIVLLPKSSLAGKTIREAALGRDLDLSIIRVVRNESQYLLPRSDMRLEEGDVLLVEGSRADVLNVKDTAGVDIRADLELSDPDLRSEEAALVEVLVVPGSRLVGRTLRDAGIRERFGVQVLGFNRQGRNILTKLSRISLRAGDVLLIQGRTTGVMRFADEGLVSVLQEVPEKTGIRPKAWRAIAIFFASIALAATNLVPLAVAVMLGAFAVLATRCVAPVDAYRETEWRVVILIACMLALGQAIMKTGAAQYLAAHADIWMAGLPPIWIIAAFFVLTVVLAQPMSNQAAAALMVPIAVQTASHLHLNPRTFVMTIAVAASCSFLTPLEHSCLIVYGPGHYRFKDFIRVGAPLVIVLLVIVLFLVPRIWPLHG
ncbi:MAG TPA: SLC13 family permease [Opitutaceae bacterium]|nr:SLC13 family permease [Opitutaceae bacterium]